MADQIEKNGQAATGQTGSGPDTGTTEPQKTEGITLDKLPPELIDQLSSQIAEKFKAEISSRDKKITEYQKSLKEKELEGKTEKEKSEMLQQQKEKELQEKEAELEVAQANFLKTKMAADEKLDPSAIELITGRSEIEIKASLKKVKSFWDKAEQAGVEKALKGTNTTPQKGQGATSGGIAQLQAQLAEAKQKGDTMGASRLLRIIEEERKKS